MDKFYRRGMKAKTIKAILRKRVDDWLESIEDKDVRDLAAKGTIVTGGAIASMLLGEKVNDFDLYFRDKTTCLVVARYYVKKFKQSPPPKFAESDKAVDVQVREDGERVRIWIQSAGIASAAGDQGYEYFEADPDADAVRATEYVERAAEIVAEDAEEDGQKYRPLFLTSNAVTLSDKVQLVVRFYGEPEEIHKNYDFVHCTSWWESWTGDLHLLQPALESLLARELRYIGSLYPLASVIRTRKFIKRGWTCNAGQYLKMIMQAGDLDLHDLTVLEDQLVGVDLAYFQEILEKLREKGTGRVSTAYLLEIVDRVF
jgi:hypothetical protein